MVSLMVLAWAGLAGCASSPSAQFYTLVPIAEVETRSDPLAGDRLSIGLGPLAWPLFLDRPQLVRRDGVRLRIDEFHRWGGSLNDDFLRVWGENLAYLLDNSRILVYPTEIRSPVDYRVLAEILTFEGRGDQEVVLKVRWVVTDPYLERALVIRETSYRRPLTMTGEVDDEARLVIGLSEVLGDFSRDVAAALRRLPARSVPH
ncbi:PqiC family protein [Thioalkalicoccus limnaeus]|uniref:PqiC family protein n=1 Tax=Thioalkalicoccus limnaeus TaxID=120681 RepID=A0ABV4BGJ7_9GAMM